MKPITYYSGESGKEICNIPAGAVEDIAQPGPNDNAVAAWLDYIEWLCETGELRKELDGYGAWEDLDTAPEEIIRERMLWIAAHDIAEEPEGYPQ